MHVYTPQRKKITLSKRDFVCQGGEARVYAKGPSAYKLYLDPKKAIQVAKIRELSRITNPMVIKPEEHVCDSKGNPLGYRMAFVRHAESICRLFTRAFKDRNNIGPNTIQDLVLQIRKGVEDIHRAGALIVDLNEMNLLVDHKFRKVFFIDVDSYQTPTFPATAIMPSVRDWKCKLGDFTENSDWFSFAIVTFQLFIGIHPYKGKHKKVKGLEERMKQGVSVFNSAVSTPKVCYPLSVIPSCYLDWYKAVLENGKRCAPPIDFHGAVIIPSAVQRIPVSGKAIIVSDFSDFVEDIRGIEILPEGLITWTDHNVYFDQSRIASPPKGVTCFGRTKRKHTPVGARIEDGKLVLNTLYINPQEVETQIEASKVVSHEGCLYVQNKDRISQVVMMEMGSNLVPSLKVASNVLPHATQLFPGVAVQNLLGSSFVSLYPAEGHAHQVRIEELDGRKIIEARLEKNVLMVMTSKRGRYDRFIFKFDEDFLRYDVRKIKDVPLLALNFVVLDRGICICLTEDEEIEVFSASYGSSTVRVVKDPAIGSDMALYKMGDAVLFPKGNKIFRLRLS